MILKDVIDITSKEKPNSFTEADIAAYVTAVEAEVAEQMHIANPPVYKDNHTDLARTLLAPPPYDVLYLSYVKAKIDYANEELDSYANNIAQHETEFADFVNWTVRTRQNDANNAFPHKLKNTW